MMNDRITIRRDKTLTVRVQEKERALLQTVATKYELKPSELLRKIISDFLQKEKEVLSGEANGRPE